MYPCFLRGVLGLFLFACLQAAALADLRDIDAAMDPDPGADPCADFYTYACGGWLAANQSGLSDHPYLYRAFDAAEADIRARLQIIFEAAKALAQTDPVMKRISGLYEACLDETQIEADGLAALQPILADIDAITGIDGFLAVAGELTRLGAPTLLSPDVAPDVFTSLQQASYVVFAYAGEPGYPDGDIYLGKDKFNKARREVLKAYIGQVLSQFGFDPNQAGSVLAIDQAVTKYSSDFGKPNRIIRIQDSDLPKLPRTFNWKTYTDRLGANGWPLIIDYGYLQAIAKTLSRYPLVTLKAYLHWRLATAYQHYLPSGFRTQQPISGIPRGAATRAEVCVDETSYLLGDVVGARLIDSDGTAGVLSGVEHMYDQIKTAMSVDSQTSTWMTNTLSKEAFQEKLNALRPFFGYPEGWPNGTADDADITGFLGKALAITRTAADSRYARVNTVVDRLAWNSDMSVQTVNAFNNLWTNQIYMLAGLLRAPFFDTGYPLSVNYGGLGYVLGHELVHGFASVGRNFDETGHYDGKGWLAPADVARFKSRSQCFIAQYGKYSGATGTRVNGKQTLEENLADNGGLHLAYEAFKADLAVSQTPQETVRGLTDKQMFFVAFVQKHCELATPQAAYYRFSRTFRRYPPGKYRALGSLLNSPDFVEAFPQCVPKTPMNPLKKCSLW